MVQTQSLNAIRLTAVLSCPHGPVLGDNLKAYFALYSSLSCAIDMHPTTDDSNIPLVTNPQSHPSYTVHMRTGERNIWLIAFLPLFLHFVSVVVLASAIRFYIDGHQFNLQSRRGLGDFTPLQSDITTAISSSIAVLRFLATMWSGSMIMRCIFILMERDRVSLREIDRLLTWQFHIHRRKNSSGWIGLLVAIILLVAFPCQLSGPILTGSITWIPSNRPTRHQNITEIDIGYTGNHSNWTKFNLSYGDKFLLNYSAPTSQFSRGTLLAAGSALTAWSGYQDDERTMKRVIRSVAQLPINSTLNSIRLPYFAISKLEWIRDPSAEVPSNTRRLLLNQSAWNPFSSENSVGPGVFALLPEAWGMVVVPSPYNGTISKTSFVVGRFNYSSTNYSKPSPNADALFARVLPPPNFGVTSAERDAMYADWVSTGSSTGSAAVFPFQPFGNLSDQIGCDPVLSPTSSCVIYGRLTYVAGAAECRNCRVSSWLTAQNDSVLRVEPDILTIYALAMMPMVGSLIVQQNYSLPVAFHNLDTFVTELLIRSYAGSWDFLTRYIDPTMGSTGTGTTDAQIFTLTSQAEVLWWRVALWVLVNLMFTFSGLLFLVVQLTCNQPLIGNPFIAALFLDTSEVVHKRDRALCNISRVVKKDKEIGYLYLRRKNIDDDHRCVKAVDLDSESEDGEGQDDGRNGKVTKTQTPESRMWRRWGKTQ